MEQIVCRHGIPQELLSDRGPNFLSTLMQEVCWLLKVKKRNMSGYHPPESNTSLLQPLLQNQSSRDLGRNAVP